MLSESVLVVWKINVLRDVREDIFLERLSQRREECGRRCLLTCPCWVLGIGMIFTVFHIFEIMLEFSAI